MGNYDNNRGESRGGSDFPRRSFGGGRDRGGFGGGGRGRSFGGGRDRGGFGGRDSGPREMFNVDCAECGKSSQVPFKPSGDRPVYCSDCFEKRGGPREDRGSSRGDSRGSSAPRVDNHKEQFEALHAKLDKIMRMMEREGKTQVSEAKTEEKPKAKAKVKKAKKK